MAIRKKKKGPRSLKAFRQPASAKVLEASSQPIPAIVQITTILATGQIVGLGADNNLYLWEAYNGTWKPNQLSAAERQQFDTIRAAKAVALAANGDKPVETKQPDALA